jgi:hypothetical protein
MALALTTGMDSPTEDAHGIQGALEDMLDVVGMQVAMVGELEDGILTVRVVAGDARRFGVSPDLCLPSRETYAGRMMRGLLPQVIPDTAREPERPLRERGPRGAPVGAFVGAPLLDAAGEPFGVLTCSHSEPQEWLGEREREVVGMVARLVAESLERERVEAGRRRADEQNGRMGQTATGVIALLTALDARDRYTGSHSQAVVDLALEVGRELGLGAEGLTEVSHVALLHDIGKIGIPDAVLQKPGPLDLEEWALMRSHPVIGAQMIEAVEGLAHLAPAIRAEHERWDGRGYPDGLAGTAIPVASRVVFVCDAFHAMVSTRPYRAGMDHEAALAELRRNSGGQFCPRCVDALEAVLPRFAEGVAAA